MKYFIILFLLVAQVVCAQPASVQTDQNNGYIGLATYVFDIAVDEILDLNDVFGEANLIEHKQIKGFKFRVYDGAALLIPEGVEATGTYRIGEYVASGTVFPGWGGLRKPTGGSYNLFIAPFDAAIKVVFWAW
jgi:hypothetical protein